MIDIHWSTFWNSRDYWFWVDGSLDCFGESITTAFDILWNTFYIKSYFISVYIAGLFSNIFASIFLILPYPALEEYYFPCKWFYLSSFNIFYVLKAICLIQHIPQASQFRLREILDAEVHSPSDPSIRHGTMMQNKIHYCLCLFT